MDSTRIQLSTGFIDLPSTVDFPISMSSKDIKTGIRSGSFSKVIEIDGNENNTTLLGLYFEIDLSNATFDRNKKTTCSIIQNGTETFTGFIQLKEVIRVNDNRATNGKRLKFKIVVFNQVSNFFNEMGDKELTDLSFPELSHIFNRANIISSWSNTEGYTYPQFAKQDNIYTLRDFKPAIYELEYWKKIFAANGYSYTFDQLTDNDIRLDKRIIPYNGKNGDDSISQFLKQSFTVRGTLASDTFLLDPANTPAAYPFSAIPSIDFTVANTINQYLTAAGSKIILDTVLEDSQSQYNVLTGELTNLAGQGRTFQLLTSYDYSIDVQARDAGSNIVAWETEDPNGQGKSVQLKLTLICQSLTDNSKVAYIDAGTTVVNFQQGTTNTYASGFQNLGSGTNASFADFGLFDANEEFDTHIFVMARYQNQFGALVDPANSNNTSNEVIKFVDQATGDEVKLEFDIDITNLEFKAVPDITELVKGSAVDIDKFIPKGIKQRDVIKAISETYNLVFVPDPENESNLIVKTRDRYYDDGATWDWTDKFQEAQPNNITFLNNEVKRDQAFKYKEGKDSINVAYQDDFSETYGESTIVLDNEYTVGTNDHTIMYAPTPSVLAGVGFPLPSINGINPEGNLRVLLHNGLGNIYQYPFYDDIVINPSELAYITNYNLTSMFDSDFTPNFSILFNAPKVIFHGFQAGQTSNYIYNLHHQRETTTLNQGQRLTAYFNLSELDAQRLSERLDWTIYIKDNGYFYIEKVHNYNTTKRTLTKVDLITADEKSNLKVLNPTPPIKPNILYDDIVTDFFTDVANDTNVVIGTGQVNIQGAYNLVTSDKVFIQGNQNTVNANNAKVIGDNNTIPSGFAKSTVIGNENTVTKSGVIINTSESENFVYVSSLFDFPNPNGSNKIILEDNITYYLTTFIDLLGNTLVGGENTTIIGGSSENCGLTSTGLATSTPLLKSQYTTPIRHITIKNVGTALDFDGDGNIMALDWTGVNFLNVPTIGIIQNCSNFIFTKGAFLNSGGMSFDGTIGTVAFNNSLFDCDSANTIFDLQSGLTITRRFRIIYSSIIALSGETAISLNASATIPNEGIILDTCNFSGGGTYLTGIDFQDNEALFVNNVGITNSKEIAQYYMNGNATVTTVSSSGVAYKVAGTTINGALTSKFTHTNNRAAYTGSITRPFYVTATLSVESGNNNVIGIYISKNGTILTDSEVYITTNAGGRAEAATVQTLTTLEDTDYIEIFVENDTSTSNITVTDLNVIIQ